LFRIERRNKAEVESNHKKINLPNRIHRPLDPCDHLIDDVIANHPENIAKFKAGNTKLLGFFVGQVLKATGGKGNPKVVNTLVAERLNSL
jgi:Asp-tRNA(Asn)/Glu-tRNA(Gln) amidotransferase B subunit